MRIKIPEGKTLLYMPVIVIDEDGYERTARCLESLKEHTEDYFLVVMHNDGDPMMERGAELLKRYADYYFIQHNPDASMLGTMMLSVIKDSADWGVQIHNDLGFTDGWLDAIREQMKRPEVGISSLVAQYDWSVPRETKDLIEKNRVMACCLAMRSEAIEKIGWWDEKGGIASDADYWVRMIKAGYEVHINHNAFVYNKTNLAFKKLYAPEKLRKNYEDSYAYFKKKWAGQDTYGLI